jgi:hypothetical protein
MKSKCLVALIHILSGSGCKHQLRPNKNMEERGCGEVTNVNEALPYNTEIASNKNEGIVIYRASITTSADAENWLKAFESATTTHWVVSRTYRTLQKLVYRKDYVCHRSALRRANSGINEQTGVRKNERGISKNCGCPAALTMKIYMKSSREQYAKVAFLHFVFFTDVQLTFQSLVKYRLEESLKCKSPNAEF